MTLHAALRALAFSALVFVLGCTEQVDDAPTAPCGEDVCEGPVLPPVVQDDPGDALPPPPAELPTCADVDDRLLADFGLIIQPGTLPFDGLAPADLGCEGRIEVYRMFVAPFAYAGYGSRLRRDVPVTLHLYRSDSPRSGWCSGYVPNARAIQIRDLQECLRNVTDVDDRYFRSTAMFLIHESGHVIADRNAGLKDAFRESGVRALDPQCYDDGFLKTYSLRSGVNAVSESFAEAVALFVWNKKRGVHASILDFEAECPHTREWIRTAVFEP